MMPTLIFGSWTTYYLTASRPHPCSDEIVTSARAQPIAASGTPWKRWLTTDNSADYIQVHPPRQGERFFGKQYCRCLQRQTTHIRGGQDRNRTYDLHDVNVAL